MAGRVDGPAHTAQAIGEQVAPRAVVGEVLIGVQRGVGVAVRGHPVAGVDDLDVRSQRVEGSDLLSPPSIRIPIDQDTDETGFCGSAKFQRITDYEESISVGFIMLHDRMLKPDFCHFQEL